MTAGARLLDRLERASDLISPIVVKEVRQMVRGREFAYSFGASLVAGLAVAFFGAADALTGTGTSGRWTFGALMACLALLGIAVVPLGAFSALRVERLEQTLELITLTALTARRVVIGKLLAQAVKLGTLFAGMAPFVAMSFLLGGIDFATILLALAVLFMWSLWVSAACLFLSSLLKSRAMVGLVFGGVALVVLFVFGLGRMVFFFAVRGAFGGGPLIGISPSGADFWWVMAIMGSVWLVTLMNLVLLAENRLALATSNRVTPLRLGFLVQFLVIVGWSVTFADEPPNVRREALQSMGVFAGIHLALVAMFTVTEDLLVPRRVLQRAAASRWRSLGPMLLPGGGRGAVYIMVQVLILLLAAVLLRPTAVSLRWISAICAYVCFFTGLPVAVFRVFRPAAAAALRLRVALLLGFVGSLVLPDLVHYVVWQPEVLSVQFSARHLVNPIRALANWNAVEASGGVAVPFALGFAGVLAYAVLIHAGSRLSGAMAAADAPGPAADAGEPGRADILY